MATTAIYDTTQPILTKRTTVVMFLHMKTVQVNSHIKQEDKKHIRQQWLATCPKAQVCKLDCKVDTGVGCNIMPLYIHRDQFWGTETGITYNDDHQVW